MSAPQTPKAAPNSSRKRAPSSALSRSSATASHASKMTAIFRDAAIPLRDLATPSSPWQSNTKRSRIPHSQARNIHFGSFYSESTRNDARADTFPVIHLPPHMKSSSIIGRDSPIGHRKASIPPDIPYGIRFPSSPYRDSSSFPQPVSTHVVQSQQVAYPKLGVWADVMSPSRAITYESADEECHSSHGVPLILPVQHPQTSSSPKYSVHEWLESVSSVSGSSPTEPSSLWYSSPQPQSLGSSSSTPPPIFASPPKLPAKDRKAATSSSGSSNKENRVPVSPYLGNDPPNPTYLPSGRPPTTNDLSANLTRYGIARPSPPRSKPATPKARRTVKSPPSRPTTPETLSCPPPPPHHLRSGAPSPSPCRSPRTPTGYLNLPPRRQRARTFSTSEQERAIPVLDPKSTFTIYEDEDPVQLSPEVERHRKGKGPKRERCVSYWDEDIIGTATSADSPERLGVGGQVGEAAAEGLEMVASHNGKQVLVERDMGTGGEKQRAEEAEVLGVGEAEEESERGRGRRFEFMVGKRGRGLD